MTLLSEATPGAYDEVTTCTTCGSVPIPAVSLQVEAK